MRELFVMDLKNYDPNGTVGRRPSVRGIIIRDGRIAMMHSCRYDYYKLPGGGIEPGESLEEKLLTKESAFEIHQILHALEEPYKEVFSLRTFGELPFRQIGELFGKTESWARVTYHRARLKIKEELK